LKQNLLRAFEAVRATRSASPPRERVRFPLDSPLEGTGFERSVPPDRSSGGTYPADNRSDASTLFSSGARRRASCHSNPIGVIAGSGYIVRELSFSPKETRIHKWDQEFESTFLQRRVSTSYLQLELAPAFRAWRGAPELQTSLFTRK
jgi:hypothetical protein